MTQETAAKFTTRFKDMTERTPDAQEPYVIEVSYKDRGPEGRPIRYSILKDADSDRYLMLGKDMSDVAMIQKDLMNAQIGLRRDFEAMRPYQRFYRTLMSSMGEAILIWSSETDAIRDLNGKAAGLLGSNISDLKGKPLTGLFVDGDDLRKAAQQSERDRDGGSANPVKARHAVADESVLFTFSRRPPGRGQICCGRYPKRRQMRRS